MYGTFPSIHNVLAVLCLELRQPFFLQPAEGFGKPFLERYNRLVLEVALGRRDVKPSVDDEHLHLERGKRRHTIVDRVALPLHKSHAQRKQSQ